MAELPEMWWSDVVGLIVKDPNGYYYRMSYIVSLDDPIAPAADMARLEFASCEVTNGDIGHNYTGPLMGFTYKIYDCLCIKQESHVEHQCAHGERWLS